MVNNNWNYLSLPEVCEINPGKKELREKDPGTEVSFVPMACVSKEGKISKQEKRKLKDVIKGYTYFRDDDVLVAKITPCFENGKRAIARNLFNGLGFGSTEFHVLRSGDKVLPRWIYYAISRDDFINTAKSRMTGTAGQKRVPKKVLEEYKIPVPDIKEQEWISNAIETQFTRLDATIKSLTTVKNKLRIYRQSILKAAFVSVDGHNEVNIGEISTFIGSGITPRGGKKNYKTSGIPFIRSQNVYPFNLITDDIAHIDVTLHNKEMKRTHTQPDDVLLNITGASIGRCAIVPDTLNEGNVNQHVCIIRTKDGVLPKFLCAFLNSPIGQLLIMTTQGGVTRQGLNYQQLRGMKLPLPGISKQKGMIDEIESRFSVIDKVSEVVDNALRKAKRLRKSILKSAFEGKLIKQVC